MLAIQLTVMTRWAYK